MFEGLRDIANNMISIDGSKLVHDVISIDSLQAQIIDLNQSQLYDKGVDSLGNPTGEYSLATIYGTVNFEGKIAKGQPTDHVTLKDSGASYASMEVVNESDGFYIKGDFPESVKRGWPDALGLTTESLNELMPEITERLQEETKNTMLK